MLPITRTTTDASTVAKTTNIVALDYFAMNFQVSLNCQVTGTVSYTVQYTFDKIQEAGWTPATGNWTNHPSLTAQTATKDSNIAYPVTAVRMTQASGSGSVVLTVIQTGGGY